MCAIAKPDQFVGTLAACGLDVVYSRFLDDHEKYTAQQLIESAQKAKANGAVCLVCTEKDMVKLDPTVALALPIYWLKIEIDMMTPDVWKSFVARHLA